MKAKAVHSNEESEWSDCLEFTTLGFSGCVWKECPDTVDIDMKYSVDKRNMRIATKTGNGEHCCTVVGSMTIPPNKATSWNIMVLKSRYNNWNRINIGVSPFDINQNEDYNYYKCGWYLEPQFSKLYSGPPHGYGVGVPYGPRRGRSVCDGKSIGVVMDTRRSELSFFVGGVNLGVAFEGIPLDRPLVPCVLMCNENDSVELDMSEVRDNIDISIPILFTISSKSSSWNSITLSWAEAKEGSAYQVEVDGTLQQMITGTSFKKGKLLPGLDHTFRVRTVKGGSVSKWSCVVKGRTLDAPGFAECAWKECPCDVAFERGYSLGKWNSKIATKINDDTYCTVVGNTPLPGNQVASWDIKVLNSKKNDGDRIFIGTAPFDVDQNGGSNFKSCGWYFNYYYSTLFSGPPHKVSGIAYGPRKEDEQYADNGDSVGVVMDTKKGELSFILAGAYIGTAFEGIPLDKPLVPCVLLWYGGDSVEINTKKLDQEVISF